MAIHPYCLQTLEKVDLVIGGVTALEKQGLGHYLSLSDKKVIHLYGTHKIPDWADKVLPGTQFIRHNISELISSKGVSIEKEPFSLESFTKTAD